MGWWTAVVVVVVDDDVVVDSSPECIPSSQEGFRYSRGPPGKAVVCESNITASFFFWGGGCALFSPGYERNSPVAPSDFDRHPSGYRLTRSALRSDTTLLYYDSRSARSGVKTKRNTAAAKTAAITRRQPSCAAAYSWRHPSGYRLTRSALRSDTTLLYYDSRSARSGVKTKRNTAAAKTAAITRR